MTGKIDERRSRRRLRYRWFMKFGRDVEGRTYRGRMVDVSARGAAFEFPAQESCPVPGTLVSVRFSVPRFGSDISFDSTSFDKVGRVCRVENAGVSLRRIAIQFAEPLPFEPGEQAVSEHDRIYKLATGGDGLSAAVRASKPS